MAGTTISCTTPVIFILDTHKVFLGLQLFVKVQQVGISSLSP